MSSIVKVEDLSKMYKIYDSPAFRLKEALQLFGNKKYHREFFALKNISFNVSKGETLGIIGKNGSGKSTLLKILTGVVSPTTGEVTVQGKISSLLELGAGFNPELTGLQNIYFNGTIMGFTKQEVDERLDDILSFADIGDFVHQPVKTYSSGMFVRLAFASAISIEPDVLIVDEALAVGDIAFQNKCFRKFEQLKEKGTTILFVTHSMELISRHCNRALLLQNGELLQDGDPNDVMNTYTKLMTGNGRRNLSNIKSSHNPISIQENEDGKMAFFSKDNLEDIVHLKPIYNQAEYRWGDGRAKIVDFLLMTETEQYPLSFKANDLVTLFVKYVFYDYVDELIFGMVLKTLDGIVVSGFNTKMTHHYISPKQPGESCIVKFTFNANLTSGKYLLSIGCSQSHCEDAETSLAIDRRNDCILLNIINEYDFTGIWDPGIKCTEMACD